MNLSPLRGGQNAIYIFYLHVSRFAPSYKVNQM